MIRVQEGNTNTFDGILGYAPPAASGGDGIVTGLVDVSMKNLFGTARKLSVHWQRDGRNSQEMGFRYTEPWVFDLPLTLTAGFNQRQQDTIYVRRGIEARADALLSESLSLGGTLRDDNIIPAAGSQRVAESRSSALGVAIRYDTRDDLVSPTAGINYRTEYEIGSKRISAGFAPGPAPGPSTLQRISLDADFFTGTLPGQVAVLGLHARQITNDALELGDL